MSQVQSVSGARRATRSVRAGIDRDTAFGAVTPPLVLTTPAAATRPATCWARRWPNSKAVPAAW